MVRALSMNFLKLDEKLHLLTCRGSAFYKFFSSHCFLNSRWSTFFHAWLQFTRSGEGSHEACDCLGEMSGDPSFPSFSPINPPTCLSSITFQFFYLFFLLLLSFYQGTHGSVGATSYSLFPSSLPTSNFAPSPHIFQTPAALS